MTKDIFESFLNALAESVVRKPLERRMKTRGLGEDPEPIIVFELTDVGVFSLDLTGDNAPSVKEESHKNSNLRIVTDSKTLIAIWTRRLAPWQALYRLDLQLFGSMRLAHALQRYFDADLDLSEFS